MVMLITILDKSFIMTYNPKFETSLMNSKSKYEISLFLIFISEILKSC